MIPIDNSKKIILDLCGGTGSWSKPYKDAGYDVRNITLPDYDVRTYSPPSVVYGILAAPPCTEFSKAKTKGRNLLAGWEVANACIRIIWLCTPGLKWWAFENPRGYLCRWLGLPPYSFDPYDFGAGYSKRTWLWGYFQRPRRQKNTNYLKYKSLTRTDRSMNKIKPISFQEMNVEDFRKEGLIGADRTALRCCTNPLFAEAFFRANP